MIIWLMISLIPRTLLNSNKYGCGKWARQKLNRGICPEFVYRGKHWILDSKNTSQISKIILLFKDIWLVLNMTSYYFFVFILHCNIICHCFVFILLYFIHYYFVFWLLLIKADHAQNWANKMHALTQTLETSNIRPRDRSQGRAVGRISEISTVYCIIYILDGASLYGNHQPFLLSLGDISDFWLYLPVSPSELLVV